MSSEAAWFAAPDAILQELQRRDLVFRRRLEIPGYDDAREVRRGGQGVIYLATQRSTRRRVAIKVLFEDASTLSTRRQRFERELELVCQLEHPHIVRVYDSGVTADDRLYIVMEYVDGAALDECLGDATAPRRDPSGSPALLAGDSRSAEQGPAGIAHWTLERRLELFARICDAVQHAHQRAVLHRDLKPANILVDCRGEPRVLDFGVARSLDGPARHPVTRTGQFLGTLSYAAPEQVSDDGGAVDIRTDVYALGLILYELLTGRPPYDVGGAVGDVVRSITQARPDPPSRRCPGRGFDRDLDAIVLTALAKDPERRYQSAAALARDVRRYLGGDPLEARRDSRWYVLRKTVARHRWAVAAALALALLLAGFGSAMAVLRNRAVAQRDRARTEADKYRRIVEFLDDTFYSLRGPQAGDVTLREVLDDSRNWLYVLEDRPAVDAAVRTSIGNWYRGVGAVDAAWEMLHGVHQLNREIHGDDSPEVARSLSSLGLLRWTEGRHLEARRYLDESLALRRELLGDHHAETATGMGNLALVLRDLGDLQQAEALLREQLAVRRSLLGEADPAVALSLHHLAGVLQRAGRGEEAERSYREALALRQRVLGVGHPDHAASCAALGTLLADAGRHDEAEPLLRVCLQETAEHLPSDHPRRVACCAALIHCLIGQQRFDAAEAVLMDATAEWAEPEAAPRGLREAAAELDARRR